jgi:prevent-host-death family protein
MFKIITATELTHNTKSVIKQVVESKQPVILANYHDPVAVIIDYATWQKMSERAPKLEVLEKYMDYSEKKTNLTKVIRKMRDAD